MRLRLMPVVICMINFLQIELVITEFMNLIFLIELKLSMIAAIFVIFIT